MQEPSKFFLLIIGIYWTRENPAVTLFNNKRKIVIIVHENINRPSGAST